MSDSAYREFLLRSVNRRRNGDWQFRLLSLPALSMAIILSGFIGKSLMRIPPSALAMALPMAGATGGSAASPIPLAPKGPSGWGVSTVIGSKVQRMIFHGRQHVL